MSSPNPPSHHSQDPPSAKQPQHPPSLGLCKWYLISWVIMLAAVAIYVAIFFISRKDGTTHWSNYYSSNKMVSPYYSSEESALCSNSISQNASDIGVSGYRSVKAVALSLVFSWLIWKLPLSLYTLSLAWDNSNKIVRFVSWGISLAALLAFDILLTTFIDAAYYQPYFYAANFIATILVSALNNRDKVRSAIAAAALPLLYIALLMFIYSLFWPYLYSLYLKRFPEPSAYVQIYLFPLWDLLMYSFLLLLNAKSPLQAKPFLSTIQYLIQGYLVGMILLVGVTEVEFYYIVVYMLFRNFFSNWVMWRWEDVVNNPACLPVWILPYYLSYAFNFLPLIEMGSLIISKSFFSQQFSQACMLLYYYPTTEYPYSSITPRLSNNMKLRGYIFWVGALIIWVVSTASQKYSRRKPTGFDFFYSVFGIYLFYYGVSSGLQLQVLSQVAFK